METSESIQSASRETCLGIPLVEERQFTKEEREAMQRKARRSLWEKFLWPSVKPSVCLSLIMIGVGYVKNDGAIWNLAVFLMLFMFSGVVLTWQTEKKRKVANKELQNGCIKCYYGFAHGRERERDLKKDLSEKPPPPAKIGGVKVPVWEPIALEVFAGSRRLSRVNDTCVEKEFYMPIEHTSLQTERAQTVAKWVPPARVFAGNKIDYSESAQRELSREEEDEMRRHARTLWRKPLIGSLFLIPYLIVVYYLVLDFYEWLRPSNLNLEGTGYLFMAFAIWSYIHLAKIIRLSWRLSQDANLGIVIVTRHPDDMNGEELLRKGAVVEWMPFSGYKWTVDGEPALWRLRG